MKSRIENIELPPDELRRFGYAVVDMLVEASAALPGTRVTNPRTRTEMERRLREPLPENGREPLDVLERVRRDVLDEIAHVNHPRFFAYVPGPGNMVSALAEALSAGFNVFAGAWAVAPGPTEVELVVLDWLCELCGLPEGSSGVLLTGGSVANMTGLAIARSISGLDGDPHATVYFGTQTHSSVERALRLLGISEERWRIIDSPDLRMDPGVLERTIEADKTTGLRPMAVVATAGTTNTGDVDPLMEIATICRRQEVWLHVDAAYGGGSLLSSEGRELLAGIGDADSITLDPHKWLFQPFETGCLLVRRGRHLEATFQNIPAYLRDSAGLEEETNFRDRSMQLTRSFRALKLWMSLQVFGAAAFREAVEHGLKLARMAERRLRSSAAWEIVTRARLAIVTFRYVAGVRDGEHCDALNRAMATRAFAEGFAVVSTTEIGGRVALRMCTINPRTTFEDIERTIGYLEQLGRDPAVNDTTG